MTVPGLGRAIAIGAPIIATVVLTIFAVSYAVSYLVGLPFSLGFSVAIRVLGGAIVIVGLTVIGWAFQKRSPASVMVSTYITFIKALRRIPAREKAGRTELLVVSGPQKYTRNPLYLGVIVMVFGWALVGGYSFVLVATLVFLIWFGVILIPFEERELHALFGEEWERYSESTPMLFPFTKRRKHPARSASPWPGQFRTRARRISVGCGHNL